MRPSLVVSGLLRDGIGLGEAARGYARALDSTGYWVRQHVQRLSYRPHPLGEPGPSGLLPFEQVLDDVEADLVVTCFNPPELRDLRIQRSVHPAGRANVGVWAWEADRAPEDWAREGGRFDEIWVYTEHIAAAVRPLVDCEVVAIPPPVTPPVGSGPRPSMLDDRPTFLALADGGSNFGRKNPLGSIEAFTRAFAPDEGPRLIVKVWNAAADPAGHAEMLAAASDRPDVDVIERFLPREELADLVRDVTCLVSLHRAEGLGLPIFEALSLGVPVVMTNWSGPAELLDERHILPVRYTLTEAGDQAGPYAGTTWAEPDLDDAAAKMRSVLDGSGDASRRAEAGRDLVLRVLSEAAIGSRLSDRVDALLARTAGRSPRTVLAPTLGVIAHGHDPWPAMEPFLVAIAPQLIAQGAELIVAVSSPEVLPDTHRPRNVRVIEVDSTSPFVLRAAAAARCDADLMVMTEDHCVPAPGWLLAYDSAYHGQKAALLAGAVGNGSMGSSVDWANYLAGFAAYAPPLDGVPERRCPTVANCAIDGAVLRAWIDADSEAGTIERELIRQLWGDGQIIAVPDALVHHTQGHSGWRHLRNHFDDSRTAGPWVEEMGGVVPSLRPTRLRDDARIFLRSLQLDIQAHPDLVQPSEKARHWLRLLAAARVVGLAVGARFGPGGSGERLD